MPLLTTLIDDKSPLITYDDTWAEGTSIGNTAASNYFLGTFMTNTVTNGQATFSFNGTAVWIYSSFRANHGSFSVQVDDNTFSDLNSLGNNVYQQPIFSTSALNQGLHTVKLTNTATGGLYVDIDMVVWQSEVGNGDDLLLTETVPDTDSRFLYQGSAWAISGTSNITINFFNNGTGHLTQTYGESVMFTFTAVSLFGTSGPFNGMYSAQLDDGQSVAYNGSNGFITNYGVTIYHADNLGPGSHQVILTCLSAQVGQFLSIDYAQLWTIANNTLQTTVNGTTGADSSASNSENDLSSGAISGIVAAVAVWILGTLAAVLFYRRRWKTAVAEYHELHKMYPPLRLPVAVTVPPTGFSSSLETRGNAIISQNDNPFQPSSGGPWQPDHDQVAQPDAPAQPSSANRDPETAMDAGPETPLAEDDGVTRRLLPDPPVNGGPSAAVELPRLTGLSRGRNIVSADHSSIVRSEAPPNYAQATWGAVGSVPTGYF